MFKGSKTICVNGAPFTQIVFEPLNNGQLEFDKDARNSTANEPNVSISDRFVTRKTKVDIMQNAINKVNLRIPIPNVDERGHTSDDFNNTYIKASTNNLEPLSKPVKGYHGKDLFFLHPKKMMNTLFEILSKN